jgi:hypothetical protein
MVVQALRDFALVVRAAITTNGGKRLEAEDPKAPRRVNLSSGVQNTVGGVLDN